MLLRFVLTNTLNRIASNRSTSESHCIYATSQFLLMFRLTSEKIRLFLSEELVAVICVSTMANSARVPTVKISAAVPMEAKMYRCEIHPTVQYHLEVLKDKSYKTKINFDNFNANSSALQLKKY